MSARLCDGRVVLITGAGRGIGREHALAFAREGARVLVNDLGTAQDGQAPSDAPAHGVVEEIRALGGDALANFEDVADWEGAGRMVAAAIERWGGLDVVVNNAGIVRDRMFVSAAEEEWDAVIRVHLKGHFCAARHAAAHWRAQVKAGQTVDARIINTSSGAGLLGSVGQSAYGAAKAGIATLTIIQATELHRYGVTANAIAPAARTRMTESAFPDMMRAPEAGFDAMDPANISPLVVWLGSADSADVTGQVFEVAGGRMSVAEGWHEGPSVDRDARWNPEEVGPAIRAILSGSRTPGKVYGT